MKKSAVCILAIGFALPCDAAPWEKLSPPSPSGLFFIFDHLGTPLGEVLSRKNGTLVALNKTSRLSRESESRLENMRCAGRTDRKLFSSLPRLIAWIKLPSGESIPVEEFGTQVMIGDFRFNSPPLQKSTAQPAAAPRP